jgi:deoxyribodipyrimidine photo-lyase
MSSSRWAASRALRARGLPVQVRQGPALAVLEALRREHGITQLLSHEETGPLWSYARDREVARWCRAQGVSWTEFAHTGVVRRLRQRQGWAGRWQARMDAPALPAVDPQAWVSPAGLALAELPTLTSLGLPAHGKRAAGAGRGRGVADPGGLSRRARPRLPARALQPAHGRIRLQPAEPAPGLRHLVDAARAPGHRGAHRGAHGERLPQERALAYALRGFAGRLRWHCHFMQKLEDEPEIELRNFARAADGLRPGDEGVPMSDLDRERLAAWREGAPATPWWTPACAACVPRDG